MNFNTIRTAVIRFSSAPILVFLGIIFAIMFFGNLLIGNLHEGIKRDSQRYIAAVGTLKASQIQDWMASRQYEASILSDNSYFANEAAVWLRSGGRDMAKRKQLIERLNVLLRGQHFRSIVLYDASGRPRLSSGETAGDAPEIGDKVRRVVASRQAEFSDLHRHPDSYLPVGLDLITPLLQGDICFGALYLVEDPEVELFSLIQLWPGESESAETQLVRTDGKDVLFLNRLRHHSEPPLSFRVPLDTPKLAAAAALNGKLGLMEMMRDYRGKEVLSYATAIKGTRWVLISKIDEDEAYYLVEQVKRATGLLVLLVFGLGGAFFWQWYRRQQAASDAAILRLRVRADNLQLEGEKRFRAIFEHAALAMARNSLQGGFMEVNDAWCRMFGYTREEMLAGQLGWQQVTVPEDIESGKALVKSLLDGEAEMFNVEKRYLRKDGSVFWGSLETALVRNEYGTPEYFIVAIQDITERKRVETRITESNVLLAMALNAAQEAFWEWDLVTGEAKFSPEYYEMLGYAPGEFPANQQEWLSRIHPDEREAVLGKIREEMALHQDMYVAEYRIRAKDGRYLWIQGRGKCIAFDAGGCPTRMVGINLDVTERKKNELQISFLAYHDKLTGLPNRTLFFDRLSQAMSQARRSNNLVALLYLDLDGFKPVNDEFGHDAGDEVLKMVAQRMLACVRGVDTVARLGGDEFAVILGGLNDPKVVESVAEKILQGFAQSMTLPNGIDCRVGASIGISMFPNDGAEMDRLLASADVAMYDSKRRGKNTFTFFGGAAPGKSGSSEWVVFETAHLVGVGKLDEEHRNLLRLLNRLNDAYKQGSDQAAIERLFNDLLMATAQHFDSERHFMELYDYPDREKHIHEHEALVQEALYLKGHLHDGGEIRALQSIKDWLLGHITHADKALGAYLVAHGAE